MDIQRLRNLTTGILHTQMQDIYDDIEALTGADGIMTHQLPNAVKAMEPWLRQRLPDPRFWDGKFDTDHTGDVDIEPMTSVERGEMFARYSELPHPFSKIGSGQS